MTEICSFSYLHHLTYHPKSGSTRTFSHYFVDLFLFVDSSLNAIYRAIYVRIDDNVSLRPCTASYLFIADQIWPYLSWHFPPKILLFFQFSNIFPNKQFLLQLRSETKPNESHFFTFRYILNKLTYAYKTWHEK